jgi:hypothetical protein
MKNFIFLNFYMLFIFFMNGNAAFGQQHTNPIVESRPLEAFTGLSVSGRMEVILIPSDRNEVEISTQLSHPDKVKTTVKGGVLKIRVSSFMRGHKIRVRLFYTKLDQIVARGNATIRSDSEIKANDILIDAKSRSTISTKVNSKRLRISAASSAQIFLMGSSSTVMVRASGGSRVSMSRLQNESALVRAITGAEIWVNPTERLDAEAGTAGRVNYHTRLESVYAIQKSGGVVQYSTIPGAERPEGETPLPLELEKEDTVTDESEEKEEEEVSPNPQSEVADKSPKNGNATGSSASKPEVKEVPSSKPRRVSKNWRK